MGPCCCGMAVARPSEVAPVVTNTLIFWCLVVLALYRYFTTGNYIPKHCLDVNGTRNGTCIFAYQKNQITELATEYGQIDYWWFDHHGSDPTHVMFDDIVTAHQPQAAMLGPDSWLTGEETG